MIDREKVIKGLECCSKNHCAGEECPYYGTDCDSIKTDAIALINEQEPVEAEIEGGGSTWWHVCGECHGAIDVSDNYCKHCGRRIKHEKKAE